MANQRPSHARHLHRRTFLADVGMGLTGLAMGSLLAQDGVVRASSSELWVPPDGKPHFAPKAKSVIWIFLVGGMSHMESFDPKPALTQYADKTIGDTPYKDVLASPTLKDNLREFVQDTPRAILQKVYPLQVGFKKSGASGIEVSDWWPHVRECIDDVAVVRSMWTTDNDHGAQLQFHTGRHVLEGTFPTVGSWVHYGLGSLNENYPQFVVMGAPLASCCGGIGGHGAGYLGPEHAGVQIATDPQNALPYATPGSDRFREEQQQEFELLSKLNGLAGAQYPEDAALRARIKAYELAFRMQMAVPELVDCGAETKQTHQLYGLDTPQTESFGRQCLVARRLVEKGVRFIQIFHGDNGAAGLWDAHSGLKQGHADLCGQVDLPIAGLLKDLKQRGMLDDTLVVLATEFGRTPAAENADGRDHHPFGFSVVMAGGGLKRGVVHGKTDELGFHAVEDRHYVTDIHATVLHQLGLDPRRLEIPGRKRLEIDFGHPIEAIIA